MFPFLLPGGEEIDREKQEQVEDAGEPTGNPVVSGVHCAKSSVKRMRRGNTLNG